MSNAAEERCTLTLMDHVSYGLFDDDLHAKAALDAVEAAGTPRDRLGVTIHRNRLDTTALPVKGTDAAEGAREGAAIAAILGAIAGAVVMGPIGLVSGGALGALYGGVAGSIAGLGSPDRTLDALAAHLAEGKVLVIVESHSVEAQEKADDTMKSLGGRVEHKPYF
jgi:hypothetical protein